jgi:hypothetical protein
MVAAPFATDAGVAGAAVDTGGSSTAAVVFAPDAAVVAGAFELLEPQPTRTTAPREMAATRRRRGECFDNMQS